MALVMAIVTLSRNAMGLSAILNCSVIHSSRGGDEREGRHDDGPGVDREHHLELVHRRVGLVESRLPLRSEGVRDDVEGEHGHAG